MYENIGALDGSNWVAVVVCLHCGLMRSFLFASLVQVFIVFADSATEGVATL